MEGTYMKQPPNISSCCHVPGRVIHVSLTLPVESISCATFYKHSHLVSGPDWLTLSGGAIVGS